MARLPSQVAEFVALPIIFKSKALGREITHYIYVKSYEPKIPDEESPRALFLVNIPVTTTEAQIRHLFNSQLGAAHVQNVYFAGDVGVPTTSPSALIATTKPTDTEPATKLGKRKRSAHHTSSEVENKLSEYSIPSVHPSRLHITGSTAIVIFLDRTSREQSLRACRKAAKSSKPLVWNAELSDSKKPLLGRARYQAQRSLTFPARADLLTQVDKYMTAYASLEEARARESAKRRAEPDEDGFVTVTRGSKGVVKNEELEALKMKAAEKQKKEKGLEDFYRFQMRERRKQEQGHLLKQFGEDQRRVEAMRGERLSKRPHS